MRESTDFEPVFFTSLTAPDFPLNSGPLKTGLELSSTAWGSTTTVPKLQRVLVSNQASLILHNQTDRKV